MNDRFKIMSVSKKSVSKKQIASLIDAEIVDRLEEQSKIFGFGSKRIIIENALNNFLDELERK